MSRLLGFLRRLLEIFCRHDCLLGMLGPTIELDSELLFLLAVLEQELDAVASGDFVIKPPSHMLEFALLVHDQAAGAVTWKALQRQTVEVVGPET